MALRFSVTAALVIVVKGQRLHALAHYAAPLPAKQLGLAVDNVAAQASALVAAMDAVLSGIWGMERLADSCHFKSV